jgi:hypothetical protein
LASSKTSRRGPQYRRERRNSNSADLDLSRHLMRTTRRREPRQLDARTGAAVKRRIAMIGRAGMSKSMTAVRTRLTLRTPDGQTVVAVGSGSPVTVTGEPLELLLFAFGRNAVHVDFGGDDHIVAALRASERGF